MIDIKHLGNLDDSLHNRNSTDLIRTQNAEDIIESAIHSILVKSGSCVIDDPLYVIKNPLIDGCRVMYATLPFEAVDALRSSVKVNFDCVPSQSINIHGSTIRTVPINTHSLTYTSERFGILIYVNYLFPGTSDKGQLHYDDYTVDVDFTPIMMKSPLRDALLSDIHEMQPLGNIESIF